MCFVSDTQDPRVSKLISMYLSVNFVSCSDTSAVSKAVVLGWHKWQSSSLQAVYLWLIHLWAATRHPFGHTLAFLAQIYQIWRDARFVGLSTCERTNCPGLPCVSPSQR